MSHESDASGSRCAGPAAVPRGPWRLAGGIALAALVLCAAGTAEAQSSIQELALECGSSAEWCRELGLTGAAARAGTSLLAGGGSELLGSAATLGMRLGSVPRIAVAAEAGWGRLPTPRFGADGGPQPLEHATFGAQAYQLSAGVGLFDGFSPAPTVGGVLSVDLLATGSAVVLPDDHGFDGTTTLYGVGGRLGILRESFTLPGIAVSAVHRWGREVTMSPTAPPEGAYVPEVSFEPSTTSIRATVGKDLLAVGLLAGVGWDRYGGPIRVSSGLPSATGVGSGVAETDDLVDTRFLAFGGASLSFLVLHLSAEVGWGEGLDPVPGRPPGGFDPGAASWFGSVGARLTY